MTGAPFGHLVCGNNILHKQENRQTKPIHRQHLSKFQQKRPKLNRKSYFYPSSSKNVAVYLHFLLILINFAFNHKKTFFFKFKREIYDKKV